MFINKTLINIQYKKRQLLLKKYSKVILTMIPKLIYKLNIKYYEIELKTSKEYLILLIQFLSKNNLSYFKVLTDIIAVDYPHKKYRFKVIYNLLSILYNTRVFVTIKIDEINSIPSLYNIFQGSRWLEREVWDLFGIFFEGNNDLRRILTDYGFEGHPLRKDFPLTGFIEVFYDDKEKRIIYEDVELAQEYRNYNFLNPWVRVK